MKRQQKDRKRSSCSSGLVNNQFRKALYPEDGYERNKKKKKRERERKREILDG
jgi:hypothetical protein